MKQARFLPADRQVLDVTASEADKVREIVGLDGVEFLEAARFISVLEFVHVDAAVFLKTQYGVLVNWADLDVKRLRNVQIFAEPAPI